MSENKKYTIVIKRQRVEVSEAVYRAYHKEREAERYQNKLIRQNELSLERFRESRWRYKHELKGLQSEFFSSPQALFCVGNEIISISVSKKDMKDMQSYKNRHLSLGFSPLQKRAIYYDNGFTGEGRKSLHQRKCHMGTAQTIC